MGNFRKRAKSRQGGLFKSKKKVKGYKMYKGGDMKRLLSKINTISKTIETKSSVMPFSDGLELGHNRIVTYSTNILATTQGVTDADNSMGTRIGDKITLKSVQIKGMIELNERYSDVGVKVMLIKSAKGDVPADSNLWQGASSNKLLDTFNTERFTVLKSKFIKMKALNMSIQASGVQTAGSGFTQGGTEHVQSRATKMFNISIPGSKFGKGGVVQYENGLQQTKFYDYHLIFFAYSNWSTSATLGFNVARVNDAFTKMHYKDA